MLGNLMEMGENRWWEDVVGGVPVMYVVIRRFGQKEGRPTGSLYSKRDLYRVIRNDSRSDKILQPVARWCHGR